MLRVRLYFQEARSFYLWWYFCWILGLLLGLCLCFCIYLGFHQFVTCVLFFFLSNLLCMIGWFFWMEVQWGKKKNMFSYFKSKSSTSTKDEHSLTIIEISNHDEQHSVKYQRVDSDTNASGYHSVQTWKLFSLRPWCQLTIRHISKYFTEIYFVL